MCTAHRTTAEALNLMITIGERGKYADPMMVICSHDYTRLPNAIVWRIACINGLTVQRLSHR